MVFSGVRKTKHNYYYQRAPCIARDRKVGTFREAPIEDETARPLSAGFFMGSFSGGQDERRKYRNQRRFTNESVRISYGLRPTNRSRNDRSQRDDVLLLFCRVVKAGQ